MNSFLSYLLCANGILILGYLAYWWWYRRDEHFQFNRIYFLLLIGLSLLLPLLPAPLNWTLNDTGIREIYENIAEPRKTMGPETIIPTEWNDTTKETPTVAQQAAPPLYSLDLKQIGDLFIWFYGVVLLLLASRFVLQLISLRRLLQKYPSIRKTDHYLIHTDQDTSAFSFFNRIVLNPDQYSTEQYQLIYEHELIHIRQRHHLDIILAELFTLFFWPNPLAWRLRSQIRQNLEFLVDQTLLRRGTNRKRYQYSLLAVNTGNTSPLPLANYFNQSLLKKRIIMMNKKKSSDNFSIRHLLLIPLLAGLALFQNPVTAQQTTGETESDFTLEADFDEEDALEGTPVMEGEKVFGIIRANTRMEDLQAMQQEFAKRGVELQYSNIDFTPEGKLARIHFTLVQWQQKTVTETLYNEGKAVEGKIVVFFFHNPYERTAKMGLAKEFPRGSFGKDKTDRLLKNTAGVVVIQEKDQEDNVWIKGHLELDQEKF